MTDSKNKLTLKTPSKINIFLKVTKKLPNGYHNIETIFLPLLEVFDTIDISINSNKNTEQNITVSCENNSVPNDSNNLCYKVAFAYFKQCDIKPDINIHITKNIPVAAGMGGGSSDAAAVLKLLQNKYNILTNSKLKGIASKLGADIPYFLNPIPSIGHGIGDELQPINLSKKIHIVILAPLFPISAAWAYNNLKRKENSKVPYINKISNHLSSGNINKLSSELFNDLSFAAYKKFPILKIFKDELINAGALNAEITGSGPTLFAICKDRKISHKVANYINLKYNDSVIKCFATICDSYSYS